MTLIFYTYVGYPLLLIIVSLHKKSIAKAPIVPFVSIILAAYNEQKVIENTIKSILSLDYPKNKRELIIVSDGSTDKTEGLVRKYQNKGVKLISLKRNLGKTNAQNIAVKKVSGEILVFMDAGTLYKKDALRKLARNFADKNVGGVTGIECTTGHRRDYLVFEEFLRSKEGQISSVFVANGALYAIRKNLYKHINKKLASDFVIASKILDQNYRFVHEKEAIAFEKSNKARKEFNMRLRLAVRTCVGLFAIKRLLNPFKYGFVSIALLSHKILRYLFPFFGILLLITNLFLLNNSIIYLLILDIQLFFYLFALLGLRIKTFGIFSYFAMSNAAILIGIFRWIFGDKKILWTPSR